jgi:hypothetical protein
MPEYRRMLIAGFTHRVSGLMLNRVGFPGLSIEPAYKDASPLGDASL